MCGGTGSRLYSSTNDQPGFDILKLTDHGLYFREIFVC
jgi:hypothetical protein